MVQNLNILSFAPYGKLLAERSDSAGLPQGEQWEERLLAATTQETYQYLPTEPVYLDYETGMSILAVAKGREEFQYFYLDKPVCIDPGVRFAVAPYQSSCTVRMTACRSGWPRRSRWRFRCGIWRCPGGFRWSGYIPFFTTRRSGAFSSGVRSTPCWN